MEYCISLEYIIVYLKLSYNKPNNLLLTEKSMASKFTMKEYASMVSPIDENAKLEIFSNTFH